MRISRLFALALAVLAAACSSHERPQRREPEWRAPVEILLKYADGKGGLTRRELEAGLRRDFDAADLNHDGVLGPDEMRAVNAKRWDEDRSAISPLQDWNGDGVVDFGEFAATARALFNEFDVDGNGVLLPNELRPVQARGEKDQQGGQDEEQGSHGRGGPPGGGHGGGGRGGRGGGPQQ